MIPKLNIGIKIKDKEAKSLWDLHELLVKNRGKEDEYATVYLPTHLESFTNHSIVTSTIKFCAFFPENICFRNYVGDTNISSTNDVNLFVEGWLEELFVSTKITSILFEAGKPRANGAACAQAMILRSCTLSTKISPHYFPKIHIRFWGGDKHFPLPEEHASLKLTGIDDKQVERTLEFLRYATIIYLKKYKEVAKARIDGSLFMQLSSLVNACKKRVQREVKKTTGKGKRKAPEYESVKLEATKPSQLASIAPWEIKAVQEVLEAPWKASTRYQAEIKDFWKDPLTIDFLAIKKNLQTLEQDKWKAKTLVASRTSFRMEAIARSDKDTDMDIRVKLRERLTTLETFQKAMMNNVDKDIIFRYFDPNELFLGRITDYGPKYDKLETEIDVSIKEFRAEYPELTAQLLQWERYFPKAEVTPQGVDASPSSISQ